MTANECAMCIAVRWSAAHPWNDKEWCAKGEDAREEVLGVLNRD